MTCRLFSYEGALKALKGVGIEKVELCTTKAFVPHLDAQYMTEARMDEMAKQAADIGIQVATINGRHGLSESGMYTGEGLQRTANTMRLASKLGAKIVTGNAGEIGEGEDRAVRLRQIAQYQRIAADIAEDYGITYCIEAPHKNTIAVHMEEILEYWDAMDPRIKITYDPAHLVFDNEDPLEMLKHLAPRVGHVHMRDSVPGNSLLPYGEGQIDFNAVVARLNEVNYQGFYTMEFPVEDLTTFEQRMKDSVEFLSALDIK